MTHDIKHLLRLNMELEGALRIVAERETPDTVDFLSEKYQAFVSAMCANFGCLSSAAPASIHSDIPSIPYKKVDSVDISDSIDLIGSIDKSDSLEPVVEEPIVEEPVTEVPIVEEPVTEEPVIEEPVVEEPVIEEPAIEEPVVEEPISQIEPPEYISQPVDTLVDSIESYDSVDSIDDIDPTEDTAPADDPAPGVVPTPVDDPVPAETPASQQSTINERMQSDRRLSDKISQHNARDLTRAFTVNEKIGFIRGLFCEDRSDFEYTVNQLSMLDSLDEAYDYLLNELGWDIENDDVKAFMTIVTNHFNAM